MMKIISAITAAVVMSGGALAINGYAKAPFSHYRRGT
jgi:hypothetical protein